MLIKFVILLFLQSLILISSQNVLRLGGRELLSHSHKKYQLSYLPNLPQRKKKQYVAEPEVDNQSSDQTENEEEEEEVNEETVEEQAIQRPVPGQTEDEEEEQEVDEETIEKQPIQHPVPIKNNTRKFGDLQMWAYHTEYNENGIFSLRNIFKHRKFLEIRRFANCKWNCKCGVRFQSKRKDSQALKKLEYPWAGMVKRKQKFLCGATLISNMYAITAAHCVTQLPVSSLQVHFREHAPKFPSQSRPIRRNISVVYIPASYNNNNEEKDVAILRFTRPINIDAGYMKPICLTDTEPRGFAGKLAISLSWRNIERNGTNFYNMRRTKMPLMSNSFCKRKSGNSLSISNYMICGQGNKKVQATCEEQSGGPLMVIDSNKILTLAGITSWGAGCLDENSPMIFTRVSKFTKAIDRLTDDSCYCD